MKPHDRPEGADPSLVRSHSPLSNFLLTLLCVAVSVSFCGGFLLFGARLAYNNPAFSVLFATDILLFTCTGAALCRFRR